MCPVREENTEGIAVGSKLFGFIPRKTIHLARLANFFGGGQEFARQNRVLICVMLLWYLAMFPGSLPFDSSEAIRMIQRNESIDWWSGTYFWFLRITSLQAETIAISSALGYLLLVVSLSYFLFSLTTISKSILKRARLILVSTPIVSVFGLTVSHDVFIISGILLILGTNYRSYLKLITNRELFWNYIISGILLTTTRAFPVYLVGMIIAILLKRKVKMAAIMSVALTLFYVGSYVGIDRDKNYTFIHVLSDLKCVVQHTDTKLNQEDLKFLSQIAPMEKWKDPSQCSNIEEIVRELSPNYLMLHWNKHFVESYLRIVSKSPAILLQAKFQRSVVALPPPFFFSVPKNMVSSDLNRPIGLGTNWSLQENGPGVLHPSIDEASVKTRFYGQELIRTPVLAVIYLVNQASWFWGWGGLWLWPSLLIPFILLRVERISTLLAVSYPLLILHGSIIMTGPGAQARHLAATIIAGTSLFLVSILKTLESRKSRISKGNLF